MTNLPDLKQRCWEQTAIMKLASDIQKSEKSRHTMVSTLSWNHSLILAFRSYIFFKLLHFIPSTKIRQIDAGKGKAMLTSPSVQVQITESIIYDFHQICCFFCVFHHFVIQSEFVQISQFTVGSQCCFNSINYHLCDSGISILWSDFENSF